MQLLTPLALALAALAIPIILLYMLKLRRKTQTQPASDLTTHHPRRACLCSRASRVASPRRRQRIGDRLAGCIRFDERDGCEPDSI